MGEYNKKAIFLLLLTLFMLVVITGGIYYASRVSLAKRILTPEELKGESGRVKKAYRLALEKKRIFENIPCYCGCFNEHDNLKECFIRKVSNKREAVFEKHGANCRVCLDEAFAIRQLTSKNFSLKELRQKIEKKFEKYGPPTKTPPPD